MRAGLQIQLIISKRLPITAGEVLRLSFDLISFANASNARYAINPVTGEIVGPYGAAVLAEIPVAGRRCLVLRGAANAFTDLGQQYSEGYVLALASLGDGIALAGTSPNGKILRSTNHGATWTDLGQQYSQTDILALASLGGGIALAGTHSGGKILRSKNNSYSQFKDQAFYTTAVVPVAFRNRVLSLRIPEYSSAELALCTPGSKRYLFRYADSGANAFGVYLLSTDQKLYAEVNGVNVAATATACTWSAYQQICARVDRAAGTVALTGMTTGDDALSFTPPAVSNGNLYLGMDDNEANQFEGFCAEPELW